MAWVGTDADVLAAYAAMGDPTRRAIVQLLAGRRSLPGGEVARQFDLAWSSVSRHLGLLRDAGLVTAERQGRNIVYSLNRAAFAPVVAELTELAAPRVRVPVAVLAPEMGECVAIARQSARRRGAGQVEPVDLLAGLARQRSNRAVQALRAAGADLDALVRTVEEVAVDGDDAPAVDGVLSVAVWEVFQAALVVGVRRGVSGLVPAHVLDALLDEPTGAVDAVLSASGTTPAAVRRALEAVDETARRPSRRQARAEEAGDLVAEVAALRRGVEALEQRLRDGERA